jgi:hypothetical protein
MPDTHTILNEQIGTGRIIVTARPGTNHYWIVTFARGNSRKAILDEIAAWMPDGKWAGTYWLPFRCRLVPPDVLQRVEDWLRGRPATPPAPEPGEVAELVAALELDADRGEGFYDLCNTTAKQFTRAAELLQQLSASAPAVAAAVAS